MFEGTRDIRAFIAGANNGRVLNGSSLADVATTAEAGRGGGLRLFARARARMSARRDEATLELND